jgi:hypothetical protein
MKASGNRGFFIILNQSQKQPIGNAEIFSKKN